jgi:acyl carrier protein
MTKIFISHGREDTEAAKKIYLELKAAGFSPWLDTESLVGGQKWKAIIRKEIRESRYFLALLSHRSVSRKGFINRELTEALEVLKEYPESEIFLIPVRLDDCQTSHENISALHRVDMFPSWAEGIEKIKNALEREKRTYSDEEREEIIKGVIAEDLVIDVSEVTSQVSFAELGGDWGSAIDIASVLRCDFGISLSDEDATRLQSVRDLIKLKSEPQC